MDITSKLPASFKNFKNNIITILVVFMCNTKSVAIVVLVFFFLLLSFPLAFLDQLPKVLSMNYYSGSFRTRSDLFHQTHEIERVKRERNRLDKQKSLTKNEKDVQKKKLTDTQVESNFATVAEELVSPGNIGSQVWVARYILMILSLSLLKYTINLFPTNCQTT